jgi:5-oxoprolinase (ATP-hydrolysing)
VFGPAGDAGIDTAIVRTGFAALAAEIREKTGDARSPEAVAEGYVRIAVENMANAIKKISVERGHDVTGYTLCCFGGAAGQHACLVADALAIPRIFIHPHAGVLSAYGMGLADVSAMRSEAVEARLEPALMPRLEAMIARLARDAADAIADESTSRDELQVASRAHLRYEGTDTAVQVDFGAVEDMRERFDATYRQQFSFLMPGRALVVESVSVEATARGEPVDEAHLPPPRPADHPRAAGTLRMYSGGAFHETPVYRREALRPGDTVSGPAIVAEANATTVVEPQWQARVTPLNHLVVTRAAPRPQREAVGTRADPVMLEIFNNLFMAIAEQMGVTLAHTAYSVNIKERLDFSCALFDADGGLIANAPHLPVHLGAMGESVRTIANENAGKMRPGDVYVLNDPYHGGTHLPDVTVVTPVFQRQPPASSSRAGGAVPAPGAAPAGTPIPESRILFYVACRGHHAEIGGITPGSMPPDSVHLDEEGALITNFMLVEQGRFRENELRALLQGARYPSRNVEQNLADLRAMVAANQKGVAELDRIVDHFGLEVVHAYMQHVQDHAEESVRRVIDVLKDGAFAYEMDNGAVIRVTIVIDRAARSAVIDFTGTSPQLPDNFNAPAAVTMSAVLYVFRTMVGADIPLNAGCLKPLTVIIPEGSMLNPGYPAAVVAGNVETSQCVTDALYGVLGTMGASQGTMNNFTFGNDRYQYYETICGGSGAGVLADATGALHGFDGTDCVHTHMTNTRLTDPEVLEWRFPVIVEEFSIRAGSGGGGRWKGGNGAVRRIRFLEAMTAAILSGHRRVPPYGMAGGKPGQTGFNAVRRANGDLVRLGSCAKVEIRPGDTFVIETPGGGGFGEPD